MTDARHIAVVPVSVVNDRTDDALKYAATLAPQVLAVYLGAAEDAQAGGIEDEWTQSRAKLPLIIVDASQDDNAGAFRQCLDVLKRTDRPDLITVVIPADAAGWCEELRGQPGIDVRQTPAAK